MQTLAYLLIVQFFIRGAVMQQGSYKAAVLEFYPLPLDATPMESFLANLGQHIDYIQQAANQGAQIIVCPEDGLTGWNISEKLIGQLSTEVPDSHENISPCLQKHRGNYAQFFVDLSCAAWKNKIYTVVNVIEQRHEANSDKIIYHNTNVAFDRQGVVIARYRKINLFDEIYYQKGDQLSTFKTDFGVTFGMFICFDILFKNPSLDVLAQPAVTDIVYSTAWFSELPFFEALSIQHGYAKTNGVNLLTAGMNDPTERNGGSGIYLANGSISRTYITGVKTSKLIIEDVPIIGKRLSNICQGASQPPKHEPGFEESDQPDINSFVTMISNLNDYTFKSLNFSTPNISETICSGTSKFCCSFNITIYKKSEPNYVYKLAAFYGVTLFSQTKTIGLRNCGLVACLNESDNSCGGRYKEHPTGVTFESISVKGSFDVESAQYRPATLNFDLDPTTNYVYCTNTVKNVTEVEMYTTKPHDSLLTFGILGRVFRNDDKPAGKINSAEFYSGDMFIVFTVSIFVFLQAD